MGSSSKRMEGRVSNSIPMEHRLLSPPLTPRKKTLPIFVSKNGEELGEREREKERERERETCAFLEPEFFNDFLHTIQFICSRE